MLKSQKPYTFLYQLHVQELKERGLFPIFFKDLNLIGSWKLKKNLQVINRQPVLDFKPANLKVFYNRVFHILILFEVG